MPTIENDEGIPQTKQSLFGLKNQVMILEQAIRIGLFRGNLHGALELLKSVPDRKQIEPFISLIEARCLIDLKQFKRAEEKISELTKAEPGCADTHYLNGELRLLIKRYKQAVFSFSTSCQLRPAVSLFNVYFLSYLGRQIGLTFLGREGSASIDGYLLERMRPLKQAMSMYWCGDYHGAKEMIEELPNSVSKLPHAKFFKGLLLQALGKHAEALEAFPSARAEGYSSSATYFFRALSHYHMGNWEKCALACTRILEMPLGVISLELWPATQSVRIIDVTEVLKMRSESFTKLENYGDALADYDRLVEIDPTCESLMKRSSTLYRFGFARAAYEDIVRAESLNGETIESRRQKMRCLVKMGKTKSAMEMALTLLEENPEDEFARMTLELLSNRNKAIGEGQVHGRFIQEITNAPVP